MDTDNSIVLSGHAKDISGMRFGRLTASRCVGKNKFRALLWECRCECGGVVSLPASALTSGNTKSCGCLHVEQIRALGKSMAVCDAPGLPETGVWKSMIRRCCNPNDRGYHNYGGRGISVCESWKRSCRQFISDVGPRPSPLHQIDRINNDGNYEPGNCRWVLPRQQQQNRRSTRHISYCGVTKCIAEWARELGIGETTIAWRLKAGWSIANALTTAKRRAGRNSVIR